MSEDTGRLAGDHPADSGNETRSGPRTLGSLLDWPVRAGAVLLALALVGAIVLLATSAWRNQARLKPILVHHAHVSQLQRATGQVQGLLTQTLRHGRVTDGAALDRVRTLIDRLATRSNYLAPATRRRLAGVRKLLAYPGPDPAHSFSQALAVLRQAMQAESGAYEDLLAEVDANSRVELGAATALVAGVLVLLALLVLLFRRRILLPLRDLNRLIGCIARQEYRSIPSSGTTPLLEPLFANFNRMVGRLSALEREHEERRQSLEGEVRAVTERLLQQQQALARAERLAAVGELSAGLAHELRNPLSGLQVAVTNLRKETTDPGHIERLDLINGELNRLVRLLNDLLEGARHSPEAAREVDLADTLAEFVALARYQVPEGVTLVPEAEADLRCRLPENGLHHALLNLTLNSAQAIGEGPGEIRLSAGASGGRLRLTVCDSGPGFPERLLAQGIQHFATQREGGTGLGLAMVRRFARDLGGEVHLFNPDTGGGCVTLSVPCRRPDD
ncbi:MAG TPA: HAMP domain-containing sensor histidine kinase [Gammaproteobacteria bacterium]|nr:HAMP domain-containing sensor histidine kinase [Gammaproteobacteria bacterium]